MKSLQGEKLNHYPLNLTHVADLLFFDGALLSLFENQNKEDYLYYWCDVDETCNRWLVFEVSSTNLRLYLQGKKSLYEIVTSPVNHLIYAIDMNNEGEIENIYKIKPENLPEDYIPDIDSYYDISESDERPQDKTMIYQKLRLLKIKEIEQQIKAQQYNKRFNNLGASQSQLPTSAFVREADPFVIPLITQKSEIKNKRTDNKYRLSAYLCIR